MQSYVFRPDVVVDVAFINFKSLHNYRVENGSREKSNHEWISLNFDVLRGNPTETLPTQANVLMTKWSQSPKNVLNTCLYEYFLLEQTKGSLLSLEKILAGPTLQRHVMSHILGDNRRPVTEQ